MLPEQKESIKLHLCGSDASSVVGLVSLDLACDLRSRFITRKYTYIPGFRSVFSRLLKTATDFMGLPSLFVSFFYSGVCATRLNEFTTASLSNVSLRSFVSK